MEGQAIQHRVLAAIYPVQELGQGKVELREAVVGTGIVTYGIGLRRRCGSRPVPHLEGKGLCPAHITARGRVADTHVYHLGVAGVLVGRGDHDGVDPRHRVGLVLVIAHLVVDHVLANEHLGIPGRKVEDGTPVRGYVIVTEYIVLQHLTVVRQQLNADHQFHYLETAQRAVGVHHTHIDGLWGTHVRVHRRVGYLRTGDARDGIPFGFVIGDVVCGTVGYLCLPDGKVEHLRPVTAHNIAYSYRVGLFGLRVGQYPQCKGNRGVRAQCVPVGNAHIDGLWVRGVLVCRGGVDGTDIPVGIRLALEVLYAHTRCAARYLVVLDRKVKGSGPIVGLAQVVTELQGGRLYYRWPERHAQLKGTHLGTARIDIPQAYPDGLYIGHRIGERARRSDRGSARLCICQGHMVAQRVVGRVLGTVDITRALGKVEGGDAVAIVVAYDQWLKVHGYLRGRVDDKLQLHDPETASAHRRWDIVIRRPCIYRLGTRHDIRIGIRKGESTVLGIERCLVVGHDHTGLATHYLHVLVRQVELGETIVVDIAHLQRIRFYRRWERIDYKVQRNHTAVHHAAAVDVLCTYPDRAGC